MTIRTFIMNYHWIYRILNHEDRTHNLIRSHIVHLCNRLVTTA